MGRQKKVILVVSSSVVQQSVTSFLLRTWGYSCGIAKDWDDAASMLAKRDYAVILSFEPERPAILHEFRNIFPGTATVFVGSRPVDSIADAYVMPDSDKNALREVIRMRSLRRRRQLTDGEALL